MNKMAHAPNNVVRNRSDTTRSAAPAVTMGELALVVALAVPVTMALGGTIVTMVGA
jgi:hypothetical protein